MTTPLRVLHVIEALETGVARHVVDVVRHTPDTVHHVIAPPERVGGVTDHLAVPAMRDAGAEVTIVRMRRTPTRPENAAALRRARGLVRTWGPDVVHGHSTTGGVIARLAGVGQRAALVYTPNAVATGAAATAVERALARLTDLAIAVSETERDDMVQRGLLPRARIAVVANGIDLEPPPPRSLRALLTTDAPGPLIGTMGRLSPQKATVDFLQMAALIANDRPEARFVLIGDGPERERVEACIRATGLGSRLTWLRSLPEAAAYLHDLDVFVLPSRFEGGPYAPLEAMRAGVPVVLTDVVGSRDAVEHGRSGLLVPAGDPGALAAAVRSVVDDPARRATLVAEGRARLADRFDVRVMGARLRDAYREAVAARAVR